MGDLESNRRLCIEEEVGNYQGRLWLWEDDEDNEGEAESLHAWVVGERCCDVLT